MEQFARRLCLRVDGIPTISNESSDDVMNLTKSLFKEVKVSVPENVSDGAHRIGPIYTNRINQKSAKVLLQVFLPSTIEHYFTGREKDLLKRANNHVKEIHAINFCYADVNCLFG